MQILLAMTIPIGWWMVMVDSSKNNNLYIGRTRSFGDSPGNQYRYYGTTGPGLFIYNGVDGDNTNYSAYLKYVVIKLILMIEI